ncbi:MAG TPA: hypothetical protein VMB18_00570 [Terriglobales bacterium]|nr:hypothetical protein [Terriglobales bacterium]
MRTSPSSRDRRRLRRWILVVIFLVLAMMIAVAGVVIHRAEPILRARVIDTLSTRFKSKVELDTFHVSAFPHFEVSGTGLRIYGKTDPNSHQPGIQPIIGVMDFRFHIRPWDLFHSPMHVRTVYIQGLQLNLPPKEQRAEMKNIEPQGKIKIIVDKFVSDTAQLILNTNKPGKLPLVFAIQRLQMSRIGSNGPMHFEADLINPKPIGRIHSIGSFGPWQADSPRDTPVQGGYSFSQADLSTIKGIGGILSSTGSYAGTLDHIVVNGATDTPDFQIATAGRPLPLHTDFHAVVDGTTGDTYLRPVEARLLNSWIVATGSVVRTQSPPGHHVSLDVAIEKGRIEDLLKLAVRSSPPIMNGGIRLKTKFDLPPGEPDLANRLKLSGIFSVLDAHFSNPEVQNKIDALSRRSQGKLKQAKFEPSDDVNSDLNGTFRLNDALLSFSQLQFQVPGAQVDLTGNYDLNGRQFAFYGKARMDAKLSQMVGGWKSILLKPVDPFFHKNGAGTELPVKITGDGSQMHFSTDFHHRN